MTPKNHSWPYSLTATVLLLCPFDLLASLGMDMYLPVVPMMPTALKTSDTLVQLTLTLYLVMIGAGQLLFGPLSDRVGRRPVILGGGIVYVLTSAGLAVTSSAEVFLILRVIQACAASACLVAMFATVRDIYAEREERHVIYGLLSAMLAIVPALGPVLGALVELIFGWRAIFIGLAIAMSIASVSAWRLWPETRSRSIGCSTSELTMHTLLAPLKRLHFWCYTLGYSASMGSFFVFFSTAPGLLMDRHHTSQIGFSLLFATVAVVMLGTAKLMATLISRWGTRKTLRIGMVWLMIGATLLSMSELWLASSLLAFIASMWVMAIGIAITLAVTANGALDDFNHIAGSVTAVYFCLGGLLLGGMGTLTITLLPDISAWPISVYSSLFAVVVLALSSIQARINSNNHCSG